MFAHTKTPCIYALPRRGLLDPVSYRDGKKSGRLYAFTADGHAYVMSAP
jgi:hypothetical protein